MREMYLRLALARLRSRKGQFAVLFLVTVAGCAIALSALALRGATTDPWQRLFAATNGAHVTVRADSPEAVRAAAALPEVAEATEVIASHAAAVEISGRVLGVDLVRAPEGERMVVDRPALVQGRWPQEAGEIVFESTMADRLGIRVGDRVRVGGPEPVSLRVAGTAASAGRGNYPALTPGTAWVGAATFDRLELDRDGVPADLSVGLRLHDPALAETVAASLRAEGGSPGREAWTAEDDRRIATITAEIMRTFILGFTMLMLLAAVMLVFTLLGSRVVSEARQVALLQVAGVTPGQLSLLLAVEHAIIALAGVAGGTSLALGVAPVLTRIAASGLGTVPPSITPNQIAVVGGIAVLAATLAGATAAVRAGRSSLAVVARGATAARRSRLTSLAASLSLPAWVVLGIKDVFSRRGRAVLIVLSLALALMTTVVVLGGQLSIDAAAADTQQLTAAASLATPPGELPSVPPGGPRASSPVVALLEVMQVLLTLVALANLAAAGLMSSRERRREQAVLQATGYSPGQLAAAAAASHGLLAIPAGLIGIPLGFALLSGIAAEVENTVFPGPAAIALVIAAAMAVAAAVAAIPAFSAQRRSLAHALVIE
ncbi:MAG TPA: FtsX-like permease family protein [Candidatus Limnocylindrales bacterium]